MPDARRLHSHRGHVWQECPPELDALRAQLEQIPKVKEGNHHPEKEGLRPAEKGGAQKAAQCAKAPNRRFSEVDPPHGQKRAEEQQRLHSKKSPKRKTSVEAEEGDEGQC